MKFLKEIREPQLFIFLLKLLNSRLNKSLQFQDFPSSHVGSPDDFMFEGV